MSAQPTTNNQPVPQNPASAWNQNSQPNPFSPSPPAEIQSPSRATSATTVPARLVRRLLLDMLMSVMLVIEMLYSLTGNALHELVGLLLFVGMATHLLLSRKWLAGALRPSRNTGRRRTGLLVVASLLLVDTILLAVSSIMISHQLASWGIGLSNVSDIWYAIHTATAYGLCALTAVHLAMHWAMLARTLGIGYPHARRNTIGYAVGTMAGISALAICSKGGLAVAGMLPSGHAMGQVTASSAYGTNTLQDMTDGTEDATDGSDDIIGGRELASSVRDGMSDEIATVDGATGATDGTVADSQAQSPTPWDESPSEPSAVAGGTPNDDMPLSQESSQPRTEDGQTGTQDDDGGDDRRKRRPGDDQDDDDDDNDGSGTGSLDGFCPLCHNHCPLTNPGCMRPRNAGLIG